MLKDLFKTSSQRAAEEKAKVRRSFRNLDRYIESLGEKTETLVKGRDEQWKQAGAYLKAGRKSAAQRCLNSVRGNEVLIHELDQKQWVLERFKVRLEMASLEGGIAGLLRELTGVAKFDPEQLDDALTGVVEELGEHGAGSKIWSKIATKEAAGIDGALADKIPSIDEMMADLQDEVAGGAPAADAADADSGEMESLRQRARKVIEGK